jgi:hypothetical protein
MRVRTMALVVTTALIAALGMAGATEHFGRQGHATAADCAPGFSPVDPVLKEVRAEMAAEEAGKGGGWVREAVRELTGEEKKQLAREALAEVPPLANLDQDQWSSYCLRSKRLESLKELLALFGARAIPAMAPYGKWADGAAASAAKQRQAMGTSTVAGSEAPGRRTAPDP